MIISAGHNVKKIFNLFPGRSVYFQRDAGDWAGVFERMAKALASELGNISAVPARPLITIAISPGELLDRISILQIKSSRFPPGETRERIPAELSALLRERDQMIAMTDALAALAVDLAAVNESLWQVEDDLRACEVAGDLTARFVELGRLVYRTNDRRSGLKRRINEQLASSLIEAKCYGGQRLE